MCSVLYGEARLNKIAKQLFKYRLAILLLMISFSLANLIKFWGEWNDFYAVLAAQVYFGQAVYAYVSGRRIAFAPGGGVETDANSVLRFVVGGAAFFAYFIFFFFNGYSDGWL